MTAANSESSRKSLKNVTTQSVQNPESSVGNQSDVVANMVSNLRIEPIADNDEGHEEDSPEVEGYEENDSEEDDPEEEAEDDPVCFLHIDLRRVVKGHVNDNI